MRALAVSVACVILLFGIMGCISDDGPLSGERVVEEGATKVINASGLKGIRVNLTRSEVMTVDWTSGDYLNFVVFEVSTGNMVHDELPSMDSTSKFKAPRTGEYSYGWVPTGEEDVVVHYSTYVK